MPFQTEPEWRGFTQRLAQLGQRRLVLVEGDPQWCRAWVSHRLEELKVEAGLWVGQNDTASQSVLPTVKAGQYRRWLGRELDVVVWDGFQGNPPDAFAALSGTLKAGGLLFWLMPPLSQWSRFEDPDYARTGLDQATEHTFLARQAGLLESSPEVIRIRPGQEGVPPLPAAGPAAFRVGATGEQQGLVEALVRFGQGRRRRPLVINADRGRGKSAALGLAAAELLLAGREQVVVTAPAFENVRTLFRHAGKRLGQELVEHRDGLLVTAAGHRLSFWPVDQLLEEAPSAEVVMVDEAAAIPAQRLRAILLGWPRVAFASTVHGYEGSGRGFAIRFRDVLDRETPHWQACSLQAPIRWADDDPLEALVFRLYLLAAEPSAPTTEAEGLTIEPWSPALADEAELAEAFGLLVNAHYRTTPADLRQWLDDPQAMSWRAVSGGQTVGVLWATREGGLPVDLAEQVAQGRRRLRGHLLAQSLASHGGFPEAASLSGLRIVRIAVTEQARDRGIGQSLVAAARRACAEQSLDYLGTSYGGDVGLLTFWQHCQLHLVRIGFQQEPTTGEYPVQMLSGISEAGQSLAHRLARRFARHWQVLLPRHWSRMSPALVAALAADLPSTSVLDEDDVRELEAFGHDFRGFELALPVLRQLSAVDGFMVWLARQVDRDLWCRAVLQGWSWHPLRHQKLCSGQKDGENRLRALVRGYLAGGVSAD
ncbi:tRNA(Met) cytidine acetyltransferase TmcA [Marinobacter oulmenensis]|uniref:tRNA(Met) cytidine acetyltransferase TmcA n=1 Tax=Marinobacter oulmenensis TaxID=643747 RepID=A0A840U933_9GAMM|nr:GNAT family N-acetyltransferase [Marinobacter oulmenensis]MBB5319650.1 tRNA(Met) cytidine acetyltransferase [Marinobacter oulmenensis]